MGSVEPGKIEQDAEEFGLHIQAGGWRMGLLVARNVARGTAGRPRRNPPNQADSVKVSASEFARLAGLSGHDVVLRYLDAWDRQAPERGLPASDKLDPGDELKLPDPNTFRFRVMDPEAATPAGVTAHAATSRYEPTAERSATRRDNRYVPPGGNGAADEEAPGSVAGGWIRTAASALESLASHASSWQYMTEADYQRLLELPDIIKRIIADVDERSARVER